MATDGRWSTSRADALPTTQRATYNSRRTHSPSPKQDLRAGRVPAAIRVTFAYCGGNDIDEVTETVDEAWLQAARAHLGALIAAATASEHPAAPSDACRHCDFAHVCVAGTAWLEAKS